MGLFNNLVKGILTGFSKIAPAVYSVGKFGMTYLFPAAVGYITGGVLGGAMLGTSLTGTAYGLGTVGAAGAAAAGAGLGAQIGLGAGGAIAAAGEALATGKDNADKLEIAEDKIKLDRTHNRESYKAQAELASLQLNDEQRSDAISAFQQESAGEAALGGSGLEGGTPFWALKQQIDETARKIGSAFLQGESQINRMGADARYNEGSLNLAEEMNDIDIAANQREMAWAPINAVISGVKLAYGMTGIVNGFSSLFGGGGSNKVGGIGNWGSTGISGADILRSANGGGYGPDASLLESIRGTPIPMGGRPYGTLSLPQGYSGGSINPGSILAPPGSFATGKKVRSAISWMK